MASRLSLYSLTIHKENEEGGHKAESEHLDGGSALEEQALT